MFIFCGYELPYRPQQFVAPRISVPLTSRDMIRDFSGRTDYDFKFAFTRKADQSIYVVDFSRVEITDTAVIPNVYRFKSDGMPDSPLFSPDGEWITWFVRLSATVQKAYVCRAEEGSEAIEIAVQGTDPHFWEDSLANLYVVYSNRSFVNLGELPWIEGYGTFRRKINRATGQGIGDPEMILDKPFNGGLSKDGRFLCTGYSDGALYDLNLSKLHRINYEEGPGSMQICNPSIAPDGAHEDWMLFLPFAGTQKLDFSEMDSTPGMIKMHEYLYIVDKANTVRWQRIVPAGYYQWQDPEWTNAFNYIVALAKVASNESDTRHDCFLVRQSDGGLLKLTTDAFRLDETATPSFWMAQGE